MQKSLFILLFLMVSCFCFGQEGGIFSPLQKNTNNPVIYDLWIFARIQRPFMENKWYSSPHEIPEYSSSLGFGIETNISRVKSKWYFTLGAGYNQINFSFDKDQNSSNGIKTHWTFAEVALDYNMGDATHMFIGLETNFFLTGKAHSEDGVSYVWFNNDCLNRFSYSYYLGVKLAFTYFSIGVKIGSSPVPVVNSDKVAYYTLKKESPSTSYLAFLLEYRIFSQRNKLKSTNYSL